MAGDSRKRNVISRSAAKIQASHAIDHVSIEETYFVAEKSLSDLLFENLGGLPPHYEHPARLKAGEVFEFGVDFRPFSKIAKEIMLNFNGPSLFGVRITAKYRRHFDGKAFTFSKGYAAINPTAPGIYDSDSEHDRIATESHEHSRMMVMFDGFHYQIDSLNADEFPEDGPWQVPGKGATRGHFAIQPPGRLKLSDLELYFTLPGHWVPVTHDVTHGTYR